MPATPKSAMRTRQQDKARKDRQDAKARKMCVEVVWKRAGACCECRGCRHCNPNGTEPDGIPYVGVQWPDHDPADRRHMWSFVTGYRCGQHLVRMLKAQTWRQVGHVDEIKSRAQGGDPHDPDNCRLLCPSCHFSGPSGAHRKSVRP